jgi:hypothetical protein
MDMNLLSAVCRATGHKNTKAPLILENLGYYFFGFWANYIMGHFSGYFEGASTFLTPKNPQKKIISRIFKISGALIVIMGTAQGG